LGLTNIINRYRLLTDNPVTITQNDGQFIVQIPLLS
jgi:two-component system, LytTR family, sensor kinase